MNFNYSNTTWPNQHGTLEKGGSDFVNHSEIIHCYNSSGWILGLKAFSGKHKWSKFADLSVCRSPWVAWVLLWLWSLLPVGTPKSPSEAKTHEVLKGDNVQKLLGFGRRCWNLGGNYAWIPGDHGSWIDEYHNFQDVRCCLIICPGEIVISPPTIWEQDSVQWKPSTIRVLWVLWRSQEVDPTPPAPHH